MNLNSLSQFWDQSLHRHDETLNQQYHATRHLAQRLTNLHLLQPQQCVLHSSKLDRYATNHVPFSFGQSLSYKETVLLMIVLLSIC